MNELLSRRAFLRSLSVLGGVAALLPAAVPDAQAAAPPVFQAAGKAGAFSLGAVVAVTLPGGHPIFVRRIAKGQTAAAFHVLSALCTHKGCPVAWNGAAKQFQCPCHGGKFDAAGHNIAGPPPRPLPSLPVRVEHGMVLVGA